MHAGGAVRTLHVAAAALVLLGAALAAWRPALARRYEWLFAAAALALVVTGIGNLGQLGGALPGRWGALFSWKLAAVGVLLALSVARVLLLTMDAPPRATRVAMGATAFVAAGIVSLGVTLAHG